MDFATNPVDGTRIAWSVTGDPTGPPVMLVHGSLLSHQIWRTFGYVRALRDRYRLILVDQRGHGRSEAPRDVEAYSMDRVSEDLVAVLDAADVSAAHYVGYSFGGRSGLNLVTRIPQRVASLVVGGAGSGPQKGALDSLFFDGSADVLAERGMDGFVDEWANRRGFPVDSGTRAAFLRNDSEALAAYFRASDDDPGIADDAVRAITAPTLFYVGSRDVQRIDDTRCTASLIAGSEYEELRGYDHATAVAAPEAVELVSRWLDTVTSSER
ncbi:alpha/beta fold hydrolase [Rhodococcus sp. SORGH_AS_0301]|uniref:alpha/beta fold hydrolase n=1 Tax=Rhodococcus sp. SORGH_AS_0301 TaxID=3041780 RepID=UPI00277E0ECD|nr:alpha/beta hydrolase [Rhodococcus sp. SORGH_AS_0301]MDQ1182777.1 pimeloyl-ACP methyl ester carboxylesterase [Rhodococcus sp. SORGH_AS_0301]